MTDMNIEERIAFATSYIVSEHITNVRVGEDGCLLVDKADGDTTLIKSLPNNEEGIIRNIESERA